MDDSFGSFNPNLNAKKFDKVVIDESVGEDGEDDDDS